MSLGEAARRLDISYRQCCRSYKRYREDGVKGLIHRRRGCPPNRAKPEEFRREVVRRYVEKYEGLGPTLTAEKLAEEGRVLDHETLSHAGAWFWPRANGRRGADAGSTAPGGSAGRTSARWCSSTRAPPAAGFGNDYPRACLVNMADDATGTKHKGAESGPLPSRSGPDGSRKRVPSKTHPWRRNYKLMWGSAGAR